MCQFPMSSSAADPASGLPAAYVALLLDVVKRWNISEMELLSRFGLDRQMLTSPTLRIPLETVNDIYRLALELTEEPGLPFYLGMQMKLSSHGFIGFAAMTADTLAQALERETWEEAGAKIELGPLFTMFDVIRAEQVHIFFRAEMPSAEFAAGEESLDVKLFAEEDIPWDELAFKTVSKTLTLIFADRKAGRYTLHTGDVYDHTDWPESRFKA